jgi:hypothetical protein
VHLSAIIYASNSGVSHFALPELTIAMASQSSTSSQPKGLPFPVMQAVSEGQVSYDSSGNIESVPTKMNYVTKDTTEINVYRDIAGCDSTYEGAIWDPVSVPVKNGRLLSQAPNLTEQGYQLLDDPIQKDVAFLDSQSVIENYYPICEKLLQRVLGPKAVCIKAFDHNIRISGTTFGDNLKGGGQAKAQVPIGVVHGDYTTVSAPRRLTDLAQPPKANDVLRERLGDTPLLDPVMALAATKGKRRFALINVWRNIDGKNPVLEFPLACMDATSFDPGDLRTLQIHYKDRIGENYFCAPSEKHEWNYFPRMTVDEVLLIKQWDSFGSLARNMAPGDAHESSTFAIHSAFMDPTTTEKRPPRQSIEVRCAIMWEEEVEL